jgi:hypothetical protein
VSQSFDHMYMFKLIPIDHNKSPFAEFVFSTVRNLVVKNLDKLEGTIEILDDWTVMN